MNLRAGSTFFRFSRRHSAIGEECRRSMNDYPRSTDRTDVPLQRSLGERKTRRKLTMHRATPNSWGRGISAVPPRPSR